MNEISEAVAERFWNKVERIPFHGCWEWAGARAKNGYGVAVVGKKWMGAHRLAWMINGGGMQQGIDICHKCDNRGCVRPSHLFAGSRKDNMEDCVAKGRQRKGVEAGGKLSPSQVRRVRSLKGKRRAADLAEEYGVVPGSIYHVWKGTSYKWVT